MSYRFSDSPSGRERHWERRRRRSRPSAPWFIRPLIILLAFALIVVVTWRGIQYALHTRPGSARANAAAYESANPGSRSATNPATNIIPGWQRDVIVALDEAQRHASEGDATETSIAVDRAASIVIVARLRSQPTPPDFFDDALSKLDQVLAAYHTNSRLTEHVTDARIELAELRSSIEPIPPGTPSSLNIDELLVATATGRDRTAIERRVHIQHGIHAGRATGRRVIVCAVVCVVRREAARIGIVQFGACDQFQIRE